MRSDKDLPVIAHQVTQTVRCVWYILSAVKLGNVC